MVSNVQMGMYNVICMVIISLEMMMKNAPKYSLQNVFSLVK